MCISRQVPAAGLQDAALRTTDVNHLGSFVLRNLDSCKPKAQRQSWGSFLEDKTKIVLSESIKRNRLEKLNQNKFSFG